MEIYLAGAIGKLARWWLEPLEYNLDIVNWADVKQQAVVAVSRKNLIIVDNTELQDETVLILVARTNGRNMTKPFARRRKPEESINIKNPREHDVELPTLSELIIAQSREKFCKILQ